MSYFELPNHFACSFLGVNSPIILRAEAATEAGGMIIEEYRATAPHVHLYGDTKAARGQFGVALRSFQNYLDNFSQSFQWSFTTKPYVAPTWFEIEMRHSNYRAILWSDLDKYNLSIAINDGVINLRSMMYRDLEGAYDRLKSVYEIFFDTRI